MRSLFLTYNGLSSHIGQAQVMPYLIGLARCGHEITVISFERESDSNARSEIQSSLATSSIEWRPQAYSNLPGAMGNLADKARLAAVANRAAAQIKPDLVHCRSYVPGDVALQIKRSTGARFLFDMRGFWVDQRAEGQRWPQNRMLYRWLYRKWKAKEAAFVEHADRIVTLTEVAREEVEAWPSHKGSPIDVIPCAVDYEQFVQPLNKVESRAHIRELLGVEKLEPIFVYLGSLGSVYLLDDILRCFHVARSTLGEGRLLFLGDHSAEDLMSHSRSLGLDIGDGGILCRRVTRAEVPAYLWAADVGLSFIIPTYSSLGVSPTKLGEYLACGLPVICNRNIGDVEGTVSALGAGLVVGADVQRELSLRHSEVAHLLKIPREAIRNASRRVFDLDLAITAYDHAYRSIS